MSLVQKKTNKLGSSEEKYEFKKTASYAIHETKFDCAWDQTGRYLALFGEKRSPLDKTDKSIKFFNIFGEQIAVYESLQNLLQFKWRPRPTGLLNAKQLAMVKQDYKTKYNKLFKEEEKSEKKQMTSKKQDAKKKVRDEFLSQFFLPLRREFEGQRDKYEALFPIKPKDMVEQAVEIEIIYAFEGVVSETRMS